MGSDKQLIQALTGIEVPADGRPADIGVIVHNVGTALAVRSAVREGKPLISRLVTVNGDCASQPGNIEVRVGTLAEEVIAFAGGLKGDGIGLARLVMGGPMMGMQIPHWRVPVVKGTSGILAFDTAEVGRTGAEPVHPLRQLRQGLPDGPAAAGNELRASATRPTAKPIDLGLKDCIACGCCAYVCPSKIPLVQYFVHAKGELAAQDRAKLRTDATKKLALQRQERLEREAREKAEAAARRKAEREAAAAAKAAARSRLPRRITGRIRMNPATLTVQPVASPHAHGGNSVTRTMFRVQMALVPATLYGFWLFGWPSFFLWLLTILSCLGFEALALQMMGVTRIKATLFDGSALLTGWLLAMTLPPWAPWWVAVLGGFIAIVIGKQVFGGVGQNVFNPAMVARVALLVSFPLPLTQWVAPLPLGSLAAPDFIHGLQIFLGNQAMPDAMASASLLGYTKTELSRGIDLLHSLAGDHAPALSWIGARSGSLGESASHADPWRRALPAGDRHHHLAHPGGRAGRPGDSRRHRSCRRSGALPERFGPPAVGRGDARRLLHRHRLRDLAQYRPRPDHLRAGHRPADLGDPHLRRLPGRHGLRRAADERADAGHRPLRQAAHPRPRPQGQAAGHSGREGSLT